MYNFLFTINCSLKTEKGVGKNSVQRAGIADGGEFYICPPGTAAWLFAKDKY